MKYIIADPEEQSNRELKNLLDEIKLLDFHGSFTSFEEAEKSIRGEPPDVAFIRMGHAALNAFALTREIRELNPSSKIIFHSNGETYAVEAFEYEADGFLQVPFRKEGIKHLFESILQKK